MKHIESKPGKPESKPLWFRPGLRDMQGAPPPETRCGDGDRLDSRAMNQPLISEVLPDLLEEMAFLLQGTGAEPLEEQLRALRIESICDCGDDNCASFATAAEVKVEEVVELSASEGFLIIDLNQAGQICFIEVLGRPDVKYLLEEHYQNRNE
jgi:hypothetical protein